MIGRYALLTFLVIAGQHAEAFTPASFAKPSNSFSMRMAEDGDVSIPYDSAARLAYDDWRSRFGKGDFDDQRYSSFKENYEAITVANVKAKKIARESGEEPPSMLTLNEFGDYTSAEYEAMNRGTLTESVPSMSSTSDVLTQAVEAAQSQAGAATALSEAADALAEEEQKLVEQLGFESVDELEAAMDAFEGVDEEGVLETDTLAREARIRSAYLEWCKKNGKEPDESRYPTFEKNFLVMEAYAQQNGKDMTLNKYADCTEEEYIAAKAEEEAAAKSVAALKAKAVKDDVFDDLDVMAALEAAAEAEAAANAAQAATKAEAGAKVDASTKAAAASKARVDAGEQKKKEQAAREDFKALSLKEQMERTEKERKARQAAQEKAAEALRLENEAAAIAATKAQAEQEAAQIARRRKIEAQAAEEARAQARQWEQKQAEMQSRNAPPSPAPKKPASKSLFQSLGNKPATTKEAAAPEKIVIEPLEIKLDGLFGQSTPKPAPKSVKKPAPTPLNLNFLSPPKASPAPKPVAKSAPSPPFFAFLDSPKAAPKPVAKASAPKPKTSPGTSFNLFSPAPKAAPKPASQPAPAPKTASPPAFNFFNQAPKAPAKATPPPKAAPSPPPKPFSFFEPASKPAPAPAPKVESSKAPEIFSFFGSKAPEATPAPKVAAPKPASNPFSFLSPAPKPAPEPAPKPPAPQPSFSFFGGSSNPSAPKAAPAPKVAPARRSGTIAIKKAAPKAEKKPKGGFSLFGGGSQKDATVDDIPVLSRFTQNADGSLTGFVSKAKGFRNGTKITTSPVKKGAKAGQVVTTGSGSKYRLE